MAKHNYSGRPKAHQFKTLYLVAVLFICLVVAGLGVLAWRHHYASRNITVGTNKINYSPAPKADNNDNNTRKGSPTPADTLDNGPTASSTNNPLGVVIVNARRSGTDVRVGNIVSGTTSGTCTLSASQAGQASPTPITAQVQLDVNNYDCGVMHISLPDTGTWQVNLTVTSGSSTASATSSVGAS